MTSETPIPEWPDDDFIRRAPLIASDVAQLLSDEPRWVHRRVETVTFNSDDSLRRRTSVDFTVPLFIDREGHHPSGEIVYVPLSLLDSLENFDLEDEAGNALPMISRASNGRVAAEILIQQAEEALQAQSQPAELLPANRASLSALAGELSDEDLEDSDDPAVNAQAELIVNDEIARGFIGELGHNFILLVPLEAKPGDHRVIKFAYDGEYSGRVEVWKISRVGMCLVARVNGFRAKARNALEILSVASFETGFVVVALSDAQSYHVEISFPDEVVAEAGLMSFYGHDEPELLDAKTGSGRLHLYGASSEPDAWGWVNVNFFLRPGLVWPVFLLSAVTTAALAGGLLAHYWWIYLKAPMPRQRWLLRCRRSSPLSSPRGSHRLVRRMFKGLRGLVFGSALISFAAAATLALNLPRVPGPEPLMSGAF